MLNRVFFIRHGDTDWSDSGRHTGRTDIPLNEKGERNAARLPAKLAGLKFSQVWVSPAQRARRTCALAGCLAGAAVEPALAEWDYGDYEGLRTAEIHQARPGWSLFQDGCPGGESLAQVSVRADSLIARLRKLEGDVALFSHGHFGRVLGARWIGLPVGQGVHLQLGPASLSALGYEHEVPVLALWNLE